jgi:hypothetical protein
MVNCLSDIDKQYRKEIVLAKLTEFEKEYQNWRKGNEED